MNVKCSSCSAYHWVAEKIKTSTIENPKFSKTWLGNLAKTLPNFEVEEKPGISQNPGIFKQYIADTYGVHSVTYEVGDSSDRNEITLVAKTSAMLLMKQMTEN